MANTYSQIYIQAVFAVKYRAAMIDLAWKEELCAVIGNLINETGCQSLIVNGVEDHIHCFFRLSPSISLSDVMKSAKAKSSKWINESSYLQERFEWQRGFGAFSYTQSHGENVYHYVKNQEQHHQKIKFLDEYTHLLKQNHIDYEDAHIFVEPI
jgi:REP element-mobilizing transposase RayT